MVVAPTRMPSLRSSPLYPDVAPSGVLPRQAKDQVPGLGVDRGTPRPPQPPVDPLAPDELAVPAKQRLWRDEERGPAFSAESPGSRGEEGSVEHTERRTSDLSPQDFQLVPKDGDLDLLRGLA
jgi:hypothetical protein